MTKEELLKSIKAGCLEAMSNDGNELSKFALFSYFAASMEKDSTTIDISDFKNGAYEEVYENFQNALIKFIKDYK